MKNLEFKGTPGPWELGKISKNKGWQCISGLGWGNFTKVVIKLKETESNIDEGLSNAKLIAAAPELLEALKVFVSFPEEDLNGWIDEGTPVTMTVQSSDLYKAINAINKVLK